MGLVRVRGSQMPTAEQIRALIKSHSEGDDTRFYSIALQVAAQEARNGHERFALELRDLVDKAKERGATQSVPRNKPIPVSQPRGELAGLLSVGYPKLRLSDMALDTKTHARIERFLLEQRQREHLLEHGLQPVRKLLLIGPPGTGKTMTSGVLAGELGLPLFSILLDGLITKFMGETAAKLRLVFDAIQQTRAVYLFDEFDAFAGERNTRNDVGEIRRVLNSFLQFLEQDESQSIIVAATNNPSILDRALFRRFDLVVEYSMPGRDEVSAVMQSRLALLDVSGVDWAAAADAALGLSHAEVNRACEQAAKNVILGRRTIVDTQALVDALLERKAAQG